MSEKGLRFGVSRWQFAVDGRAAERVGLGSRPAVVRRLRDRLQTANRQQPTQKIEPRFHFRELTFHFRAGCPRVQEQTNLT